MKDPKPHPVADLFPMLPPDELQELADDIAERGLLQPIVLDGEGRILDGRNRYAACQVHGIAPGFVTYEGDDPDGYALSVNLARRMLSKGQKAMIAAEAWSVSDQTQRSVSSTSGVSKTRITEAGVVLAHAPDLVDAVKTGATPLDAAYQAARDRKRAADQTADALDELRATAPDLADLVAEERMPLSEALAAARQREKERLEGIRRGISYVTDWAEARRVAAATVARDDWADVAAQLDPAIRTLAEEELSA